MQITRIHVTYVQSHTLLLAEVFEKFQNMCLEINETNQAPFLTAVRLV